MGAAVSLNQKVLTMKIAVGNDHRGVQLKQRLIELLKELGHEPVDAGPETCDSVDYPDIASKVANLVADGTVDRGVLVCGTGIGMAIAANKVDGIRATTVQDEVTAEICRRHNDVNVLCLSADLLGEQKVDRMVRVWIETEFDGGRHARRVAKIREIEEHGHVVSQPADDATPST